MIEIVGFLIAALVIVSGLLAVLRPNALLVKHTALRRSTFEAVTPERARVYGAVAVVAGTAFAAWIVWGVRRSLPR